MMTSFSQEQISEWAFFSGDYNKVHFDEEIARKNGLDGIIVQGMLVLQNAKDSLANYITTPSNIKFSLKQPVYRNRELAYQLTDRGGGQYVNITENEGGSCIKGKVNNNVINYSEAKARHEIKIDKDFLAKQINLYKSLYPNIKYSWIIMDALLFSICFKYQNGDPFYAKAQKITKEPDKSKVVTFQVDQDILITEHILSYDCTDLDNLTFYYEDQDILKEDYSVYSLLNYQVYRNNKLLYQSTMGSITRAFEALSKAK